MGLCGMLRQKRNTVEDHSTSHGNFNINLNGNPRQAHTAYHGRSRYNRKTHGHAYGMQVAMEYAVGVAVVLRWVDMVGTTEVTTEKSAVRAMPTTVALAVEAPCMMESSGACCGNPRISTESRGKIHGRPRNCHGHSRGPPPKLQIMCICGIVRRVGGLWVCGVWGFWYRLVSLEKLFVCWCFSVPIICRTCCCSITR